MVRYKIVVNKSLNQLWGKAKGIILEIISISNLSLMQRHQKQKKHKKFNQFLAVDFHHLSFHMHSYDTSC